MPVKFQCTCGRSMNVKDALAGKLVKCPACETKVRVPFTNDAKARISLDLDSQEELDLPPELADVGQRSDSGSGGGRAYGAGGKSSAGKRKAKASGTSRGATNADGERITLEDCPECGSEVKSIDLLCTSCGAELQVDTPEDPKRKMLVLGALGALLLVIVVVVAVVVLGGSSGEAEYAEGVKALGQGRFTQAVESLELAVAADAENAAYHLALAQAFAGVGNYSNAQKAASRGLKVVKEGESVGPFHLLIGECWLELGKAPKAIRALHNAKGDDSVHQGRVALLMGDALLLDGDPTGAIEQFEQAMESEELKADGLCGKGRVAYWDEDQEEAERLLQAAIGVDPEHFKALRALTELCLAQERLDDAAGYGARAVEVRDDDPEAWLLYGRALYGLHHLEEARVALEEGLSLDDENSDMLGALVKVYIGLGPEAPESYSKALELVELALEIKASPELHLSRGRILMLSGKKEEALQSLKESGTVAARVEMGKIHFENGDFDLAIVQLEHGRKVSGLVEPRLLLGKIYYQRQELAKVIEVLEEALSTAEQASEELLMLLGRSYAETESHQSAETVFARLTGQYPQNVEGLLMLGQAQFAQEKYDATIETLDRLLELESDHQEAKALRRRAELARFGEG